MHSFSSHVLPTAFVAAVCKAVSRHQTQPDHRMLKRGNFQSRNRNIENHQQILNDTHLAKRKLSLGKALYPGSVSQARKQVCFSALAKCCVALDLIHSGGSGRTASRPGGVAGLGSS